MTGTLKPLRESLTPGEERPIERSRRRLRGVGVGLVVPIAVLACWEVGAVVGFVSTRLIPAPSQIGATLVDLADSGDLWAHSLATTLRVLAGFCSEASPARSWERRREFPSGSNWARFASSLAVIATESYEVVEVRSRLSG